MVFGFLHLLLLTAPIVRPLTPVEFGVDMKGVCKTGVCDNLVINTTKATGPFITLIASFSGSCDGYMSWIWPGGHGCTNLDGFGGRLYTVRSTDLGPGSWSVQPSCEAVPGHLSGCNNSCFWNLRADIVENHQGVGTVSDVVLDTSTNGTAYPYLPAVPFAWTGAFKHDVEVYVTRVDKSTAPCTVAYTTNEHVSCPTHAGSSTPKLQLNASSAEEVHLCTVPAAAAQALALFADGGKCTLKVRLQ
jgi:hypothetical protein